MNFGFEFERAPGDFNVRTEKDGNRGCAQADAFALYRSFQSLGGVIGFGLSPFLAVHGGTTSDPDQLRTEIELTAAVGIAGPSTTKPQRPCALIGRLTFVRL